MKIPGPSIEKKYLSFIAAVSVLIPLVIAYLVYRPQMVGEGKTWVFLLPHLNALINGATSILLLAGLYFIRRRQINYHRTMMLSAFILGSLFLVSYIIYHSSTPSTSFGGSGWIKTVYYFLLLSHILLAAVVVPLVLMALYFAFKEKITQHKRIVKFAFPIWLYVSITGVAVYLMISPYYP